MKRFQSKRGMFFLALLLIIILVAYYLVSNTSPVISEEAVEVSDAKDLLLRDLEKTYPPSPKEVVKYYSEITKVFYEEATTEEEIEMLAQKSRELFDDELKAIMTDEEYLIDLKLEIETFAQDDLSVLSYSLSNSVDVEYFSEDGSDFARLYAMYTMGQGTAIKSIVEVFILREDEDKHWKIYGWDLAQEE